MRQLRMNGLHYMQHIKALNVYVDLKRKMVFFKLLVIHVGRTEMALKRLHRNAIKYFEFYPRLYMDVLECNQYESQYSNNFQHISMCILCIRPFVINCVKTNIDTFIKTDR